MRSLCALLVGAMWLGGVAQAQTSAEPAKWYAEAVAQSAFGNVTSQSYGAEAGVTVWKTLQIFGEFGHVRNVASSEITESAQMVAAFLSQTLGGVPVSQSVREPTTFFAVGVRYPLPVFHSLEPYVLGGFGAAKVSKDVSFSANGTDITSMLPQLGVVLGNDLSGSYTKPMLVVGGGVVWPAWNRLIVDFQFRYNHISAADDDPLSPAVLNEGTSIGRAGVGVGWRF